MPSTLASTMAGPNPGLQSGQQPGVASLIDQARRLAQSRGEPVPDNMTPSWAQWYLQSAALPKALPAPDPAALDAIMAHLQGGTNPDGPAASGLGTNVLPSDPRMNLPAAPGAAGAPPPMSAPPMPSAPPGAAGGYGMAAQAPQPGPMDASLMSGPPPAPMGDMTQGGSSLPIPLDKPPAPSSGLPLPIDKPPPPDQSATAAAGGMGVGAGQILEPGAKAPGKRRIAAKATAPSESDALNNQQVALAIARRLGLNRARDDAA